MAWIDERIKNLTTYPVDFTAVINEQRFEMFQRLSQLLTLLQTQGGAIENTPENLILIDSILAELGNFLFEPESQYILALNSYLQGIVVSATAANAAMNIANAAKYQEVLGSLIIRTQQLFDKTAVSALTTNELRSIISGSVQAQSTTFDAIEAIKKFILGGDQREFFLKRYAKTWALTGFASAERQYVKVVADDIGVTRWEYAGGTVDDSRQFCLDRVGRTFTKEEIESWPETAGQWAGRAYGTTKDTIWDYLGGFNCMHILAPVLENLAPAASVVAVAR